MDNLNLYLAIFRNPDFSWTYNWKSTKTFDFKENQVLKQNLEKEGLSTEDIQDETVLEKTALPFLFYIDEEEFLQEINDGILKRDCVLHKISKESENFLFYNSQLGKSFLNGKKEIESNLLDNTVIYFEFLKLLESHSLSANNQFEFTDFYSKSTRKIVLASHSERKKIVFQYPQRGVPAIDFEQNRKKDFENFKTLFSESRYYQIFLKKALISKLNNSEKNLFRYFFLNLTEIINEAKINFDVHLHELSLDKIKNDYKNYQEKFYSGQNDILNKTSNQVIALPLSIAGSAFAIYKLQDSIVGLCLIVLGLFLFLIYMSYLISIYHRDLMDLRISITKDFKILSSEDFFRSNNNELEKFKEIKNSLIKRVSRLNKSLKFFFIAIWMLTIGLTIYSVHLIDPLDTLEFVFLTLFLFFIYSVVDVELVFREKENKIKN